VDRAGVVDVVEVERPGDTVHAAVVHLFQGDDVGAAETVAPQHLDGAVDPTGQLDVEGDDPDRTGDAGIIDAQRVLAREPWRGGIEQVGGAGAAGQEDGAEHRSAGEMGQGHGVNANWIARYAEQSAELRQQLSDRRA